MATYEDSISGETDISGTPPPVRQPAQVKADQSRTVQARNRPVAGAQKPQEPNPLESAAKGVGKGAEQTLDTAYGQRPFKDAGDQMFSGWNPVDWAKQTANDAGMVWSLSRQGYQAWAAFTDPNKIHQSISVAFQGHDARSRAIQAGIIGGGVLASAFPMVQVDVAQQDLQREQAGQRISPLEDTQTAVSNAPRELTNPLNYLGGEGKAGTAALAAAPILQSFLAANPDEQKTAFIWAGIAGALFGVGHLGALRPVLEKLLGDRAPQILQALESSQAARQAADEAAVDPQKQGQQAMEYLDKALAVGGMKPYSEVKAEAARGEKVVPAQIGEHGEIKLLTADEQKRIQKGLAKIGVTDVEGLIAKASQEGGLGGKAMKWVVSNWKALGMPYDLVAKMAGEAAPRDPRAHLEQIADEELHGKVAAHLTHLNYYLAEIGRGIFTNAHDPAAATLRSLVGETRNLNRVHSRWMASMLDALGEWGQKEENGVQMMKAAEGDVAAYEDLPPEAKAAVDGFGLLRAWLRDQSQGTRYAKNFVPNWVPRLDTVKLVQGRGRPTTGAVLAKEARKHRALALSAGWVDTPPPAYQGYKLLDPKLSPEQAAAEINKRTLYHGSSSPDITKGNVDPHATDPLGRFGYGFYATDRPETAATYSGKRGGFRSASESRHLYRMQTRFSKVLDAERPMSDKEKLLIGDAVRGVLKRDDVPTDIGPAFEKLMSKAGVSAADIYRFAREEIVPHLSGDRWDKAEPLTAINDALRGAGYEAIAHEGGTATGSAKHQAVAMLEGRNIWSGEPPGGPALASFGPHSPGEMRLQQTLRYPTVQATNEAMARSREDLQAQVLATDKPLRADLANDPEIQKIREMASEGQYEEARKRLAQLAFDRFPSKDENFLRVVNAAGYQARSILSERAVQELLQTKVQSKHLRSGVDMAAHAMVQPENNRQRDEFLNQGYVRLSDSKFSHVLAEPGFAKLLDRYTTLSKQVGGSGLRDVAIAKQMLQAEKAMVKVIMYSPAIHGINMLGRLGMAATLHPIDMLRFIMHGEKFVPGVAADDVAEALMSEPYASGYLPNYKHGQWADWAVSSMHNALGDIEESMPEMQMTDKKSMLSSLIPKPVRGHNVNEWFWNQVQNFGVMMYWLEKQDALHAGRSETWARLWAGRRANSWAGAVAPEDTNPMLHDASRMLLFAPNWWRTWGELMVPIYRRSGIFGGDEHAIQFAAKQAAKTAMAAFLFQKMTGNAMNYMLSGHFQDQNQPGQQDRLQITRPSIIHMLQGSGIISSDPNSSQYIDPETGVNPRTGAILTMENPFARQQYASEMAAGYQSGQPGTTGPGIGPVHVSLPGSPEDTWDGLTNFAASRTSPFLNAAMAAANVDLYGTLTSGQTRSVIQGQPTYPSWKSLVVAMTNALPGAQQFVTDVQRTQDPNAPQSNMSLWGTKVPNGVADWVHAAQDVGSRTALSAVTGINSPTVHAQRSRGQQLSDADYQRIQQVNQKYHDEMTAASASALNGQMTPYQWRQAYSTMSKQHTAAMQALYKNAPEYVNGGDALASKWDQLYDQATLSDGSIDQGRLAQLQTQFLSQHTPEQRRQMNAILRANDTKYGMLALYHHVLDGYNTWQEEWAAQQGMDVTRIRQEVAEYNSLYSRGVAAQRKYLGEHPELLAYRSAIKTQFDRTPMGLAYGLFYGQQAAIREAAAQQVSLPTLEQAVGQQAEQQPAAPAAA